MRKLFQSTLPARGATRAFGCSEGDKCISIHAPRTGSDQGFKFRGVDDVIFQSTLPARGATYLKGVINGRAKEFQSTLPARGATDFDDPFDMVEHFNPRSPHGERRLADVVPAPQLRISIHAPRTGSDWMVNFVRHNLCISIHAPRTGSDVTGNIHPSHTVIISIHAPRTGSDVDVKRFSMFSRDFNPRSPHGERRQNRYVLPRHDGHFNPRSPHGERPNYRQLKTIYQQRFQSTLPARGATKKRNDLVARGLIFQSTLPARGATRFA